MDDVIHARHVMFPTWQHILPAEEQAGMKPAARMDPGKYDTEAYLANNTALQEMLCALTCAW